MLNDILSERTRAGNRKSKKTKEFKIMPIFLQDNAWRKKKTYEGQSKN